MTNPISKLLLCAALPAALFAGCGGSSSTTTTTTTTSTTASTPASTTQASTTAASGAVAIATRSVSGLGQVLTNSQGRTLYIFMPDKHVKVTCTGSCAQLWPPAKLSGSQQPTASGPVQVKLLKSDSDPEGFHVVTYAGWPLYTYVGDTSPGAATGQGLSTNGGLWYVISPSGKVITTTP